MKEREWNLVLIPDLKILHFLVFLSVGYREDKNHIIEFKEYGLA